MVKANYIALLFLAASTLPAQGPWTETVVNSFVALWPKGAAPLGGVIRDAAGNVYGTTAQGGAYNLGTVFKLDPSGHETVIYNFQGVTESVAYDANPNSRLTTDAQGNLYGTADYEVFKIDGFGHETILGAFPTGGVSGGVVLDPSGNAYGVDSMEGGYRKGLVFRLSPTGNYRPLYSFSGFADGGEPTGGLIRDANGTLFGTTAKGGTAGFGTVYMLDSSGKETVLYSFTGGADGGEPLTGVIRDGSGNLYGTTNLGGASGFGVVFKIDALGRETVLYSFTCSSAGHDSSGLTRDAQNNLYGTSHECGGPYGAVFKVDPTGQETIVYGFEGGASGAYPTNGVFLDAAGNFYGTAERAGDVEGQGVVYRVDAAGAETVLTSFPLGASGGANPEITVILDASGNLYGTTTNGGTSGYGGVIYKVSNTGQETVLSNLPGGPIETELPFGLVRDAVGNLFGTTATNDTFLGIVYEFTNTGQFTTLHQFTAPLDGFSPIGSLALDAQGNLYGATVKGGSFGEGTIYKVDPAGNETVLYSFGGYNSDAANPAGGVILDGAGNLYGMTSSGGAFYSGAVYELTPSGQERVVFSFRGMTGGYEPVGSLAIDPAGNLYGATTFGGLINAPDYLGYGVVFKLDPNGVQTVLYAFTGEADGYEPESGVTLDAAGNLYGTTSLGGNVDSCALGVVDYGCGVVYKITPAGAESVLYAFTGGADGANPYASVTLDSQGNLYGTTLQGGTSEGGVIFKLEPNGGR